MKVNNANLKFKNALELRKTTNKIIVHHSGVTVLQTVQTIHDYYLHRTDDNYSGIGYHYYIRKDGTVWQGRPENTVGAHCYHNNFESIGICFEGNFETEKMNNTQYTVGIALIKDILIRYKNLAIKKHKDFNATDCPGKNFPFAEMAKQAIAVPVKQVVIVKPIVKPKPITNFYAKGRQITLKNAKLFASSTSSTSAKTISGSTYWIFDGIPINGRYRITNQKNRVGIQGQVTGYIDKSSIK
jgi:hypothetical protein